MKKSIFEIFKKAYSTLQEIDPKQIATEKDIVTNVDIAVGTMVTNELLKISDKKIKVVSEEFPKGKKNYPTDEDEDYYIVVDDVDGTDNLYRCAKVFNLPYATSIVVFHKEDENREYRFGDIIVAACIDYAAEKVWYTEKGLGSVELYDVICGPLSFQLAFKARCKTPADMYNNIVVNDINDMQHEKINLVPIKIPKLEKTKIPVVLTDLYSVDSSIIADLKEEFWMKDFGSSVAQYCYVAAGIFDGFVSNDKKPYELGILYLMATENGLLVRDFNNQDYTNMVFKFEERYDVIAGGKEIEEAIYELIK